MVKNNTLNFSLKFFYPPLPRTTDIPADFLFYKHPELPKLFHTFYKSNFYYSYYSIFPVKKPYQDKDALKFPGRLFGILRLVVCIFRNTMTTAENTRLGFF